MNDSSVTSCGADSSGIVCRVSLDEDEAEAWIRERLEPTGDIDLVQERPWGTVRRVPTADGNAWFKECAPTQAFEPSLTAALSSRWPDRLPEVLAYDIARSWLLVGDAGEPLGFDGGLEPWLSVLPRYAELQQGEATHLIEHLAGGVPDRRLAVFPTLYDAALGRELPVGSSDQARLRAFAPRFAELCHELAVAGLAATIQHDDLHGANVYSRGDTLRIVDWGDSCVSHPFLTVFVTFSHLEELGGLRRDDRWFERLRDAYLEPWGRSAELRPMFERALRLGAFAHLFKELRVFDAIPEIERPSYAPPLPEIVAACLKAAGLNDETRT
jgi:hypothetical protein